MRPSTRDLLLNAFSGESMAHTRYLIYAEVAEREGFRNVSRLFRAVAFAELVHARNHYDKLKEPMADLKAVAGVPVGLGNTSRNLELAIMGEKYEVDEMYPTYLEVAKFQNEKGAELSFRWAYEAEKIHARLYEEAKSYVDKGEDWPVKGKVWICPICGHTYVGGEAPERCPVCGAPRDKYVGF